VHVRRTLLLAPAALLCLAGCGPPKAQTPGHYAVKGTADCLRKSGLKVVPTAPPDDLVAQSAPAGTLRSSLHGKRFLVLFGNTQDDSKLEMEGYRRAAPSPRARRRLGSLLDLEGNALVYWATEPTAAQADAVRGCLRS
jgi:hypothetical protein